LKKPERKNNKKLFANFFRERCSLFLLITSGAPHMAELPQVWGWPLLQYNDEVRNDSGIINDLIDWTDEDVLHTIYFNKLYANFAHTG